MKCRLIQEIGNRYLFGCSWHTPDKIYHVQEFPITKEQFDSHVLERLKQNFGKPTKCSRCDISHNDEELSVHASEIRVWNTEDGKNNHPGDMFFTPWMHNGKCMYWDNCIDPKGHLMVVLPNNHIFDTDSRASNCNKPKDRTHRCWEKKGEPPLITIGGPTSDNGVGSIGMADYHGYITNGVIHN